MRHHDVYLAGCGSALGTVTPVTTVPRGALRLVGGQRSVSIAEGRTGPDLAVVAGRNALASTASPRVALTPDLHLHSTIWQAGKGLEFWSSASYLRQQLGITAGAGLSLEINAMSNSMLASVDLAAVLLAGQPAWDQILLTGGEVFGGDLLPHLGVDMDIAYGDGASAAVLARGDGIAEIVASASYTDPHLEGLHRGNDPLLPPSEARLRPIDLRARKAAHLARCGRAAVRERVITGVVEATKTVLADAGVGIGDLAWVLAPHYGHRTLASTVLDPLGITPDRTSRGLGDQWGHLGPHDQLAALSHLLACEALSPGDLVLLVGTGVGMTWTSVILRIATLPAPGVLAPHATPGPWRVPAN